MCAFAASVIITIETSYHINKPDIATIGHSGHTTYTKYPSLENMQAVFGNILKRGKIMLNANKNFSYLVK